MRTNKLVTQIWMAAVLACALTIAAGFGVPLAAQGEPARVAGEIRDQEGRTVAGATLELKNSATGETFNLTTDGSGKFNRSGLPAGKYTIALKQKDTVVYSMDAVLSPGEEALLNFNFKEMKDKEEAEAEAEARRMSSVHRHLSQH